MAAIDFPASPVNGQVFSASNGVAYVYSTTLGLWQAQGTSSGFVGDFMASSAAGAEVAPPSNGAWFVIKPSVIGVGNAGGWYNAATGRYTPPKGRYRLFGEISFNSSSAATQGQIKITKNGVNVPAVGFDMAMLTAGVNAFGLVAGEVLVDASGTDYFEFQTQSTVLFSNAWGRITAIPISPNANMVQGTGDFSATNSAATGLGAAAAAQVLDTIRSGNSGGWYNPSTGRYTPPAGRYHMLGTLSSLHTGATHTMLCQIVKNGSPIAYGIQGTNNVNTWASATIDVTTDANGTDWFELQAWDTQVGTQTAAGTVAFMSFPISGIKGPQGDPGAVGQAGANAFNIRATNNDTINGPNYVSLFRTASVPVVDYDPSGVLSVLANNTFFTAPNAGRYHFEAYAYSTSNPTGQAMLAIQHQNAAGAVIRTYGSGGTNDSNAYGAAHRIGLDLQMAAGERIYFMFAAISGTCNTAASGTIGGLLANALVYAFGHRVN